MRVPERKVVTRGAIELRLRSPEESDAETILRFLRTLFHESSDNMNGPPDRFDKITPLEQGKTIEEFLAKDTDFFLSAFFHDSIVGNLSFRALTPAVSRHCGELGIGVLKAYQNRGVGSALMQYCIDTAKKLGIWNIRFTVRTFNSPGIRLYEKMGFQRIGLLKSVAKIGEQFVDEYLYQGIFNEKLQ